VSIPEHWLEAEEAERADGPSERATGQFVLDVVGDHRLVVADGREPVCGCRGSTPNGATVETTTAPASSTSGSGSPSGPRSSSIRMFIQSGVSATRPSLVE